MGIDIRRVRGWVAAEDEKQSELESQDDYDARVEKLVRGFLIAMVAEQGSLSAEPEVTEAPKVVGGQA